MDLHITNIWGWLEQEKQFLVNTKNALGSWQNIAWDSKKWVWAQQEQAWFILHCFPIQTGCHSQSSKKSYDRVHADFRTYLTVFYKNEIYYKQMRKLNYELAYWPGCLGTHIKSLTWWYPLQFQHSYPAVEGRIRSHSDKARSDLWTTVTLQRNKLATR